jgi:lycopene cyclase domain-containing protein
VTYALTIIPFGLLTVAVTLATIRRPHFGRRMLASAIAATALLILTAVFDNVMIGAGLVAYPEGRSSGLTIGIAPLEDFSYALCAAFLVPAAYTLLTPRREA